MSIFNGVPGATDGALWARYEETREEMLWDVLDAAHTSRAFLRVAASATWIALAVLSGASGWALGLVALIATSATILHARRQRVIALSDRLGAAGRFLRWFMPYPRIPRLHPLGILDFVGVLLIGLATGRGFNIFHPDSVSFGPAAAATVLAWLTMAPGGVNMSAHVSWMLGPMTRRRQLIRAAIPIAAGICVGATLYPAGFVGRQHTLLVTLALTGGVFTAIACWTGQWLQDEQVRLVQARTSALRSAARVYDSHLVHQLKNIVSNIYESVGKLSPSEVEASLLELSILTSATEQQMFADESLPNLGLTGVVRSFIATDRAVASRITVTDDLDHRDLSPGDSDLLVIAAMNLLANGRKAAASSFAIGLTALPRQYGSLLRLHATCCCAGDFPLAELPAEGSLMKLAKTLHAVNGRFIIGPKDHAGCHDFTLTWPTIGLPRRRPEPVDTWDQEAHQGNGAR